MKIYLEPTFRGEDKGDGGIRRIVEAQVKHMQPLGFDFVDRIEDADLVATHARVLDVPVNKPWVIHTHGLYWSEYNWPKWCHNLNQHVVTAMRRADVVTAPSEWVAQVYRRGMWLDPIVLYHGVDIEDWQPGTNGGYVLWNKTRVDPVCDPAPVNELASLMPEVPFISTFANEATNVRVTDRLPYEDGKDITRNAGVYLATTRETFGIGTIEAMACGVPIVGWAWGGQREIIEHGVTGWLVKPGDYDGLVEGIRWAFENRDDIGRNTRNAVLTQYTWDHIIPRYADLYRKTLEAASESYHRPKISVVIPCYNLGRYLGGAVSSLLNSTEQDWEAIIVDDASTDRSGEIADEIAATDPRIKVIHNQENQYLAGALNTGMEASRGRYIIPLDADNMLSESALQILSNALDQSRSLDIAYGGAIFVLEDGVTPDQGVSADGISGWPSDFSFAGQMMQRNQIPSTSMFRRKVWQRSGGYRKRYRTAEDAANWVTVSSLGFAPRKVTNIPTLIYRQREDSMSRVEAQPDWTAWVPWAIHSHQTPFGVASDPPKTINGGIMWHVPTYEPPKVSVIIPVGPGHEELLIDALDSVEAQTFRDWECIVVNDTGHELSIPHTWARVIDTPNSKERFGPARSRNIGIEQSSTSVFVPLDADDFFQADALSVLYAAHAEFGGVVYSQWWDDYGHERKLYDPPDPDPGRLVSNGAIHAVTAMYSKSDWEMVGGFDESLSHWEDWDFAIMLAMNGVCSIKVPKPLFNYRKSTGYRREANNAEFDQGRIELQTKWKTLGITPEAMTMACGGGCGGNRYANRRTPPMSNNVTASEVNMKRSEGHVLMRYNSRSAGTRPFTGAETGTKYRFGTNAHNRVKWVFENDVPHMLELMDGALHQFEVVDNRGAQGDGAASPEMVATGAPKREGAAPVAQSLPEVAPAIGVIPDDTVSRSTVDGQKLRRLPEGGDEAIRAAQTMIDDAVNTPKPETSDVLGGSIAQLKENIDEMSLEDIGVWIAKEKAGKNRAGAIKVLTDAMMEKANA